VWGRRVGGYWGAEAELQEDPRGCSGAQTGTGRDREARTAEIAPTAPSAWVLALVPAAAAFSTAPFLAPGSAQDREARPAEIAPPACRSAPSARVPAHVPIAGALLPPPPHCPPCLLRGSDLDWKARPASACTLSMPLSALCVVASCHDPPCPPFPPARLCSTATSYSGCITTATTASGLRTGWAPAFAPTPRRTGLACRGAGWRCPPSSQA
jgi:hypothetical protein